MIIKPHKSFKMEKFNQIIDQSFELKLEQLIEEISSNEFVTEVGDKIFEETGKNLDDEQVKRMIGERLTPILINFHQLVLKP